MSENKLQCEIIQDLLPSYVDGLTNEVTNEAVEEHLKECENCTKTMERMQEKEPVENDEGQKKEIDFLRKTRRKTFHAVIVSMLFVVAVIAGIFFVRYYCIGVTINPDMVASKVVVSGNTVNISGTLTDATFGLSGTDFQEKDGVVTITFRGNPAGAFLSGNFESEYTSANPITQVRLGERIVWDNGVDISPNVSAAYNAKHPYVGEASDNVQSLFALGMYNSLGNIDNELQTTKEPYGWELNLEEEILTSEENKMQENMKSYAYVLLATIDNLGYVTYNYTVRGESAGMTITREDASSFAGMDIKSCGETPAQLQTLMEKTGLNEYGYASSKDYEDYVSNTYLYINIVQDSDAEITEMGLSCSVDGEETVSMGCARADGDPFKRSEVVGFEAYLQDLGIGYSRTSEVVFKLQVTDAEGNVHEVDTPIQILPEEGDVYNYILTGNVEDGFEISQ